VLKKIFDLLITIGALLTFRNYMREALDVSIQETIPEIYDSVKNSLNQYPRNVFGDDRLAKIDGLALDCGMECPDNSLKAVLAQYTENIAIWELFPQVYACLVLSNYWGNYNYNLSLQGWVNNIHLAITAFHSIMINFNSKDKIALQNEYYKFAELSTMILLYLKLDKYAKNLDNIHIFIDRTLKSSKFFEESQLEEILPNILTRAVYARVLLGKK